MSEYNCSWLFSFNSIFSFIVLFQLKAPSNACRAKIKRENYYSFSKNFKPLVSVITEWWKKQMKILIYPNLWPDTLKHARKWNVPSVIVLYSLYLTTFRLNLQGYFNEISLNWEHFPTKQERSGEQGNSVGTFERIFLGNRESIVLLAFGRVWNCFLISDNCSSDQKGATLSII